MAEDVIDQAERLLAHGYPERCTGTLGRRPSWMSPDQFDPCHCDLPNGHEGDHRCEHGTEPNLHPGELRPEPPKAISVPRALLAGLVEELRTTRRQRDELATLHRHRGLPQKESVFVSLPSGSDIARWFKDEEWAGRFANVGGDATWLSEDPHSHLWKLAEVDQDEQMFYLLDIGTASPSDATGFPEGAHVHDVLLVTAGLRESLSCEWRNSPQVGSPPLDEALEWFAGRCQALVEHWSMLDARSADAASAAPVAPETQETDR